MPRASPELPAALCLLLALAGAAAAFPAADAIPAGVEPAPPVALPGPEPAAAPDPASLEPLADLDVLEAPPLEEEVEPRGLALGLYPTLARLALGDAAPEDHEAALRAEVEAGPPAHPAPDPARGPGAMPPRFAFPRDEPLAAPAPSPAPQEPLPARFAAAASPAPPTLLEPVERSAGAAATAATAAAILALLGLYVRLAPSAVLASPARQRVLEHVRGDPGCTAGTVARALGLSYKTALHHLRVLRRAGYVSVLPGRQDRLFAAGSLPPAGMRSAVVLRAPSARALLRALGRGPARARDLARALGLSETTASVQLRRLAAAGLAARGADGRWAARP